MLATPSGTSLEPLSQGPVPAAQATAQCHPDHADTEIRAVVISSFTGRGMGGGTYSSDPAAENVRPSGNPGPFLCVPLAIPSVADRWGSGPVTCTLCSVSWSLVLTLILGADLNEVTWGCTLSPRQSLSLSTACVWFLLGRPEESMTVRSRAQVGPWDTSTPGPGDVSRKWHPGP